MTKALAILGFCIAIAAAVGCGSSTDSSSSKPLTKSEFIKQGDTICEKADKTQEAALKVYLKKHPEALGSKKGEAQMAVVAGLPAIQVETEELAALSPPSGEEPKTEAIVKGIEEASDKGKEDPGSLLLEKGNPFLAVDKLAGEYGFKVCNNAL